jgi:predicted O-methyltransferase YrrM
MAPTTLLIVLLLVTMSLGAVGAWALARKLRRLRSMVRRQERHVWETHNVFRVLEGGAPLPLPGGWAASTDLLGELIRAIAARRPQRLVELGSGVSTLVIAAALRNNGAGRLISVDAEEAYAAQTREQLQRQDLGDWVELRIAALTEMKCEGIARPWYDTRMLSDLTDVDLLLIDGPPTALRADMRYPSLPFFWSRLAPGAIVLLDDAARPAERAMAAAWERQFPAASYEYLHLEKGALRITRSG